MGSLKEHLDHLRGVGNAINRVAEIDRQSVPILQDININAQAVGRNLAAVESLRLQLANMGYFVVFASDAEIERIMLGLVDRININIQNQ